MVSYYCKPKMTKIILWIYCFTLQLSGDCFKLNLALNKRAYLSSLYMKHYARYAVDGNIFGQSYAHANNSNENDDGWFVVDLGRPYQVECIVFYHRTYCGSCDDRMDNFIVGLSNNFDPQINKTIIRYNYKLCGQYNGKLVPGAVVELQCQDNETYSRYVIIQQDVGKTYLAIPELEVFGEYINYLGCFKTLINNETTSSNQGLTDCIYYCENKNYIYAAKQETKCICGNKTKHYLPLSECNVTCSGEVDYCGGSNKLSVYEVFPLKFSKDLKHKYIGCFVDNQPRDLDHRLINQYNKPAMTVDMCQEMCTLKNYLFFGLQYSYECFCGKHYGKYGPNESSCTKKCNGNHSQICGDDYRNSIYSVTPVERGSNFFKNNLHCKDRVDLDLDGNCKNKSCEDGWTGEDCTLRSCSDYNGSCGQHECLDNGGFTECICKEGYDKRFWWDQCLDIDECEDGTHSCNTSTSTCKNKEGSYDCECMDGLQKFNSTDCLDIDECTTESKCNTTTTICQNTFRSYFCECKEGFRNESSHNCRDIDECGETPQVCNLTVSNCTNTFGSYECQCLEEGSVYDKNANICLQSYLDISGNASTHKIIISLVCAVVLLVLIAITALVLISCRKKLPERLAKIIFEKNQANEETKETEFIEFREIESDPVSMTDLKDYYECNKSRLLSNFEKFPQVAQVETNYGKNAILKPKNKYKNIIPFDKNRVVLKTLPNEELSDYINASFIPNFSGTFQFIAAQGPIKETEHDFWRMILEYKVEIIIMLTNCLEKGKVKCIQYWPDINSKVVNDISVTLKDLRSWSTYEIRRFSITKDETIHEVTHMLYKCWFDHKIPENIGSLLNFHDKMKSLRKRVLASPIVVHCSAGVGRTGTFLAVDFLLHEAQETGMVDVFKCLKHLRAHRNYMIQTKMQFSFCFEVLSFYHELGSTTAIKLNDDWNNQNRNDFIDKEFQWIFQNVASPEEDGIIKRRSKTNKFTFSGCIQNSMWKFHIESRISWQNVVECCSVERNAITILVYDDVDEKSRELPYHSGSGNLYLTQRFPQLPVRHIEFAVAESDYHIYTNTDKVNIFAIPSNSFEQLRHLWTAIKQLQTKQKTLLVYADNLNKAGFVVSALNLLEMMDAVEEIDVFQVVYQLKTAAPDFMANIDQYRRLYLFAENSTPCNEQLYSNFM